MKRGQSNLFNRAAWSPRHLTAQALAFLVAFCAVSEPAKAQCSPIQDAKILAEDGSSGEGFGQAVGLAGNTLVVGAPYDNDNGQDSGSAYVFVRSLPYDAAWHQVAKLLPLDGGALEQFGYSADINHKTIVVGAIRGGAGGADTGAAYIFESQQGVTGPWVQIAKLLASDGESSDTFGISVSIAGDTCVVGAYTANPNGISGAGAAYVFERDLGGVNNWGQVKKLVADDAGLGHQFGISVAIDGSTILVGAPGNSSTAFEAGAAYVFQRDSGGPANWGQVAKLLASDGTAKDQLCQVAISGDTAVVGAVTDDQNGQYAGSAYVFQRDLGGANQWGQVIKLLPLDGGSGDQFGVRTSISSDTAVISAGLDSDQGQYAGSAYVFCRHLGGENVWGELTKLISPEAAPWDGFAYPDVDEGTVVVGATRFLEPGAVYAFDSSLSPPRVYCTPKPTTIPGCVPAIQAIGVASASSSTGFVLSSGNVPGGSLGIFVFTQKGSFNPRITPFGWLCINPLELQYTSVLASGGVPGQCNGILTLDWNSYMSSTAGAWTNSSMQGMTVDGQFWYREAGSAGIASLTDSIGFDICR